MDRDKDYDAALAEFVKYASQCFGCPAHPDAILSDRDAASLLGVHKSTAGRLEATGQLEPKVQAGPNRVGRTLRSLFHHIRARPTKNPYPRGEGVRAYWRSRDPPDAA